MKSVTMAWNENQNPRNSQLRRYPDPGAKVSVKRATRLHMNIVTLPNESGSMPLFDVLPWWA